MSPPARKLTLVLHVTTSVGWLGAVAAFLALGIVGMTSPDSQMVRAVDLAAEPIMVAVIALSLASLVTGLISAVGTRWGLMRHYWVLYKFLLNLFATAILLVYTQTVNAYAAVAAQPGTSLGELRSPSFVDHCTGALLLLVVSTVLAIYKPRGQTRYGQRTQRRQARPQQDPVPIP